MNVFYKPEIVGDHIVLDPQESQHCVKVLRSKTGDQIHLIDGKGGLYTAEIIDANARSTTLSISSHEDNYEPLPYELHMAIAPTKSIDRFEWFLEKATEIGVSSITPIICDRSERRNVRIDRMEKVVISAMKQSLKAYKPQVNEAISYKKWLNSDFIDGSKFIAHCMEGEKLEIWNVPVDKPVTIAIGPEGDFTPEELELSIQKGFKPITLGNYRLRTETAGLAAVMGVNFKKATLL